MIRLCIKEQLTKQKTLGLYTTRDKSLEYPNETIQSLVIETWNT